MVYINNRFGWDPKKADSNLRKHGIGFEEAVTVFDDPFASTEDDLDHSASEYRQLAFGKSVVGNILVVVFTKRSELTRIISARKANRKEREGYEEKTN